MTKTARKCPLCDVVNPQSEADHAFPCNPTHAQQEALEVGWAHGYNHANFVDAYGGDMDATPSVPIRFEGVATHYTASYAQGVEQYRNERDDSDTWANGEPVRGETFTN